MTPPPIPQFQCNLQKIFLRRLVFPMLFGPSDGPHYRGRGDCKGWGITKGGGVHKNLHTVLTHQLFGISGTGRVKNLGLVGLTCDKLVTTSAMEGT